MTNTTNGPAANLKTVRRLTREWLAAVRLEERSDDLAKSWKLAAASDRALARLRAAQNGVELVVVAPRTRRNLALGAFAALATIGKVVAGAVRRADSLRRATVAAALARAARKVRQAVRRVVSALVARITTNASVVTVDGQELAAVVAGRTIRCCSVGGWYEMTGGLWGGHSLAADPAITTPERLLAHWNGYVANTAAAAGGAS